MYHRAILLSDVGSSADPAAPAHRYRRLNLARRGCSPQRANPAGMLCDVSITPVALRQARRIESTLVVAPFFFCRDPVATMPRCYCSWWHRLFSAVWLCWKPKCVEEAYFGLTPHYVQLQLHWIRRKNKQGYRHPERERERERETATVSFLLLFYFLFFH